MKKLLILVCVAALLLSLASCAGRGPYTVTFETDGGTQTALQEVKKGGRVQEPPDPEREGYAFIGWAYRGEAWSFDEDTVKENMTLTAQWQPATYTVTYVLRDGVNAQKNPTDFTAESENIVLAAPTRANYVFIGWTWAGQTEPRLRVVIPKGTHENLTFTANWAWEHLKVSTDGVLTLEPVMTRIPEEIEIPAIYNGVTVTSIGANAFSGCNQLKSVILPDSVTSIGDGAFSYCRSLTSIVLPNRLAHIGSYAFRECSGLASVVMPDSMTNIDQGAFFACGQLRDIYLTGSLADWAYIIKGLQWNFGVYRCTVHCTDGTLYFD